MFQVLVPFILGAVDIVKNKQARKENLTKISTAIGTAMVGAAAVDAPVAAGLPPDSMEAAITQIAMGVLGVILIFLRKRQG